MGENRNIWSRTKSTTILHVYPEGNLRADKCVFFNNEDIAEIIHRGFYG